MLAITQRVGFGGSVGPASAYLYDILSELSLLTNINLCLDAADLRSYDGASQTWTDIIAANNFFRGTDGSATAKDPTFVGTAGLANEGTYFSCDGGDLFKETSAWSFASNWHKDGGAFTILAVGYFINGAAQRSIFANTDKIIGIWGNGIALTVNSTENLTLQHSTDNSTSQELASSAAVVAASYNLVAVTFNETTTTASLIINSTVQGFTPAASTATNAPSTNQRLSGTSDTPDRPFENTERYPCIAAWSTKLTDAQVSSIYTLLKARRFTSLP